MPAADVTGEGFPESGRAFFQHPVPLFAQDGQGIRRQAFLEQGFQREKEKPGTSNRHNFIRLPGCRVPGAAANELAGICIQDQLHDRIAPFRRIAGVAGVLLLAAAVAGPVALPLLIAGGIVATSWNGLSFTAAAEISGRRQAGTAMGLQNTAMRVVATGVPVGLGALASSVSWPAAFAVMGTTPLLARAVLGPLVHDEDLRRREREERLGLESRAHARGPAPVDAVGR